MPQVNDPWNFFTDHVYSNYDSNGDVISDATLYTWDGGDRESNYDRWGIHNSFSITPGDESCQSDHISHAHMYHDWSYYEGTGLNIVGNEPEDSDDGKQVSYNASLDAAPSGSIGFTYTQYSDVERDVDEQDRYVTKYDWDWPGYCGGDDESTFDTGTEIAADKGSLGLQDMIVGLDGYAEFVYDQSYFYEVDFNQYFDRLDGT